MIRKTFVSLKSVKSIILLPNFIIFVKAIFCVSILYKSLLNQSIQTPHPVFFSHTFVYVHTTTFVLPIYLPTYRLLRKTRSSLDTIHTSNMRLALLFLCAPTESPVKIRCPRRGSRFFFLLLLLLLLLWCCCCIFFGLVCVGT